MQVLIYSVLILLAITVVVVIGSVITAVGRAVKERIEDGQDRH